MRDSSIDIKKGGRLKELRKTLGLSQTLMAERFGLKQSNYHNYESGDQKIDLRFIKALQYEFNVNPDWIESGEGSMFALPQDELKEGDCVICESDQGYLLGKVVEVFDMNLTVVQFSEFELPQFVETMRLHKIQNRTALVLFADLIKEWDY